MVRLRVGYQHSRFWPILVSFVDYYSLFWGPGVIFNIDEPRGAFTCQSSTLAVLADSGLFCGLLLTVLGSRSDFQDLRTQGCVYVSFINTRGFLSILTRFVDCYSPFWGPEAISIVVESQGALTCRS